MIVARIGGWPLRRFKTRSADRDTQTDVERIAPMRLAIQAAVESARFEREGLQQRLGGAQLRLCWAMDNEDGSYFEREQKAEEELSALEDQLLVAERRCRELDRHIAALKELEAFFKEHFPIGNQPAAPSARLGRLRRFF